MQNNSQNSGQLHLNLIKQNSLPGKCPYSEFFWFEFSSICIRQNPNTDTYHAVITSTITLILLFFLEMLHNISRVNSCKKNRSVRVNYPTKCDHETETFAQWQRSGSLKSRKISLLERESSKMPSNYSIEKKNSMGKELWKCVGKVRVAMKFCTNCFDNGKVKNKEDLYFINTLEKSKTRVILCYSCLKNWHSSHKY